MSDPTTDPITLRDVLTGAIALLASLFAWTSNKQIARIDKIESKDVTDKRDFDKHEKEDHENFTLLFNGQADIKDRIADGFAEMNKTLNGIHTSLLTELSRKADKRRDDP